MADLSLFYGWSNIDNDCNTIATILSMGCKNDKVVIAINDDLIPATLIANRLDLSVVQVKYGNFLGIAYDDSKLPLISKSIISGSGVLPELPELIIVVSYLNDNTIINSIVKYYKSVGHSVKIAALNCTVMYSSDVISYQNTVLNGTKLTFPWKL